MYIMLYFENSSRCSDKLTTAIKNRHPLDLNDHIAKINSEKPNKS